ncbi:MAG: decaprenyl-phosphate phosphoribosyltransferase [Chloroflexota bacterium]|nr:decaprenyl-phosphate phosphoribosyltransferase [Chloroflexota bacterium]
MSWSNRLLLLARLLKINQWAKNVLIFIPLVFSQSLLDPGLLYKSAGAFLCFCLLSSGVYIVLDIRDLKWDRNHPRKRDRPMASGAVSSRSALVLALFLFACSLPVAFWLEPMFGVVAVTYIGLNLLYSVALKNILFLDILCIATGLVLRVAGGTVVINVEFSSWLLVATGMLALLLAASKRRSELSNAAQQADISRPVLARYNGQLLDLVMAITATLTLGVYLIYVLQPTTADKFGTLFVLSVPIAIYGVFRYLYLAYLPSTEEDPITKVLHDGPLIACCLLWAASVTLIIYLG